MKIRLMGSGLWWNHLGAEFSRYACCERTANRAAARAFVQPHQGEQFPDELPGEAPIVRVTIGRIEVRAAPAPTPPPRKPARPAGPTLTLDAYLKARKEGAR